MHKGFRQLSKLCYDWIYAHWGDWVQALFCSQEHYTDRVTGFPFRKLILVPLITFFGNFATFFGNNFLLLLDEVILPSIPASHEIQKSNPKRQTGVWWNSFSKRRGTLRLKTWVSSLYLYKTFPPCVEKFKILWRFLRN